MHPQLERAYIAFGANLGDREKNIRSAIDLLAQTSGTRVIRVSRLIENPAVGGPPDAPTFLNGVMEIETSLGPHHLLHRLLEIEKMLGRIRRDKWEPRVIDLDIILYGEQIVASDELTIPHPLMHTRRFVLEPLAEIAPNVTHPKLGLTIANLFGNLNESRAT